MTIEELHDKLQKPMYNYKMAKWGVDKDGPMGKSCRTRLKKAEREIHQLAMYYAWEENLRKEVEREWKG